jgi:hypothetical protein
MFLHNLPNALVEIANKMGLQKKKRDPLLSKDGRDAHTDRRDL